MALGNQPTYQGTVTALVTIVVSKEAKPGSQLKLAADVRWQVCKELLRKLGGAKSETSVAVDAAATGKSPSADGN